MLHRGNSDAATRLRRAKSTSSVTTRSTPRNSATFDPILERERAVKAAARAYENANPMPTTTGKSGDNHDTKLRRQGSHLARHNSDADRKARVEPHKTVKSQQQSSRPSSTKTTAPTATSNLTSNQVNMGATAFKDFGSRQTAGSVYNTKDWSDVSRAKLRKAKSSIIPGSEASESSINDPARYLLDNMTTNSIMSGPPRSTREQQTDDAILALARDRYLQEYHSQVPMQNHKQNRSSVLVPFTSRLRKSNRDSIQSDSTFSQESMVLEVRKPASGVASMIITENKGRRISMSLKRGLRRAFGRSSDSSNYEMPPQQVDASRPHYGDPAFRRQNNSSPFTTNPDPGAYYDTASTLRHHSRFQGDDLPGSISNISVQSLHPSEISNHPARSRVTSWSDSTRDNTMVLQDVGQLPSIIESPEKRQVSQVPSIHGGGNVIQSQGKIDTTLRKTSSRFNLGGAVDSRRLLSNLKKHVSTFKDKERPSDNTRNVSGATTASWRPSSPPNRHRKSLSLQPPDPEPLTSTIRDVSREYPYDYMGTSINERNSSPPSPPVDRSVNTYSAQFAQSSLNGHKTLTPTGNAVVTESRPVSRWALGPRTETAAYVPNTSNEWRSWAAKTTAELEAGPVQHTTTDKTDEERREPSWDPKGVVRMNTAQAMERADASVNGTVRRRRNIFDDLPQTRNKKYDHMNDRFPMLPTSRKTSKGSLAPSQRTTSGQIQGQGDRSSPLAVQISPTAQEIKQVDAGDPSRLSSQALRSSRSVMNNSAMGQREAPGPSEAFPVNSRTGPTSSQNRSVESESKTATPIKSLRYHGPKPLDNIQRQPAPSPAHLDEKFLLRIRRGPYDPPSSSPSKAASSSVDSFDLLSGRRAFGAVPAAGRNVENTPPSKGQSMAEECFGGRLKSADGGLGGSSPVFL